MPNPKEYDSEQDFMGACIRKAKDEGKEQKQAVAMCLNMWRRKDESSVLDELQDVIDEGDE